jgi:hypothetical protein
MIDQLTILVAARATGATEAPRFSGTVEGVRPELAAQRVAACGFNDVWPKFDDTLQEEVIEVRNGSATEEQLRCVAEVSLLAQYYVVFPDSVNQVYQPLYWSLAEEKDLADAKAWLAEKGLLSRLPRYEKDKTDSTAFARSLEAMCGPKASGALEPLNGMATFNADALGSEKMDDETFRCLISAATVSGYRVGFIGNEAYEQSKP